MRITKRLVFTPAARVMIIFAAAKFIIHMLTASNYGYFCDELYTLALSKHLAFGYVDLPPLVPFILALSRTLLGESLFALHILPALAGSATLVFVCLITKALGGRLFAIGLSALAFIVAPVWLTMNSFFAYDSFDQLILAIFLFYLIKLIQTGNKKLWLPLGFIAGIACLTKATILFLGPGFLVALLISKNRKHLLTRWPWLGLGLFLIVISPYLLWQISNNFPTVEYWSIYGSYRVYQASVFEYLTTIAVFMNPLLLPLILLGLYRIFRPFENGSHGFLGIMFFITLGFMFALKAKSYMMADLFIPILGAGAIFIEEKLSGRKPLQWLKTAIIALLLIGGILAAPFSLPLLPPGVLTVYSNALGLINQTVKLDNLPKTTFPQTLADRFGWDNLVETVSKVYNGLDPEERKKCGIFAGWYGPAGAIDLLGPKYGLPNAVSGHLTYWLWGPGDYTWEVMIAVSTDYDALSNLFEDVQPKALIISDYTMPYNTNIPVFVCRKPKMPADKLWPLLKNYY